MENKIAIELIKLDVLGYLVSDEEETLHLLKKNNNFPWKELGEYQNLISLLAVSSKAEVPNGNLKSKILNNLMKIKSAEVLKNKTDNVPDSINHVDIDDSEDIIIMDDSEFEENQNLLSYNSLKKEIKEVTKPFVPEVDKPEDLTVNNIATIENKNIVISNNASNPSTSNGPEIIHHADLNTKDSNISPLKIQATSELVKNLLRNSEAKINSVFENATDKQIKNRIQPTSQLGKDFLKSPKPSSHKNNDTLVSNSKSKEQSTFNVKETVVEVSKQKVEEGDLYNDLVEEYSKSVEEKEESPDKIVFDEKIVPNFFKKYFKKIIFIAIIFIIIASIVIGYFLFFKNDGKILLNNHKPQAVITPDQIQPIPDTNTTLGNIKTTEQLNAEKKELIDSKKELKDLKEKNKETVQPIVTKTTLIDATPISINKNIENKTNEINVNTNPVVVPKTTEEKKVEKVPEYLSVADDMPSPIGGLNAMTKKIKYPEIASRLNVEGKVYVTAFIDETGTVTTASVVKGIGAGCDEAALETIKSTKFNPGTQSGKPVKVKMTIPIFFKKH
jgi:protein TonB